MNKVGLVAFLVQAVIISFSGVMAPGPVTAVTLGMGAKRRHAGALIAVGHGVVEFPLMVLIVLGAGELFKIKGVKVGIALAGGVMLLALGAMMLRECRKPVNLEAKSGGRGPVLIGIVLSAGNPYFLLWWATVGLALATQAAELGVLAFVIFAVLHWTCDLVWLEALSMASFGGSRLMGDRAQRVVMAVCGTALVGFGGWYLFNAARDTLAMLHSA